MNLQSVLISSSDKLDWSARVRQPVIPCKDIRGHEGIEMSNVWRYAYVEFPVRDERRE